MIVQIFSRISTVVRPRSDPPGCFVLEVYSLDIMDNKMPLTTARDALAGLLTTLVAGSEHYACGGPLAVSTRPIIKVGESILSYPMTPAQSSALAAAARSRPSPTPSAQQGPQEAQGRRPRDRFPRHSRPVS